MFTPEYYKSILNADSTLESLGNLKLYTDKSIGNVNIFLMLFDDGSDKLIRFHSVSLSEFSTNSFKIIENETGFFSGGCANSVNYRLIHMDHLSSDTPDIVRLSLLSIGFKSLYIFNFKNRLSHGALVYCFPEAVQMTTENFELFHRMNIHMNQLVEKIQFRKEIIKQTEYENLVNTLRIKDSHTLNHSYNVSFYSTLLGQKAGLKNAEIEELKLAALLHDIGKIATPDSILLKPGKLTREEYQMIQQHPLTGYELLKDYQGLDHILPIVRWHHERIDGKGYPDQLSGESIPFPVRIVSLADAFDAMTSNRVYQKSLNADEVKEQLLINAGSQFDGGLVYMLLEYWKNK